MCYQMLRCEQATDWRVIRCCGVNRLQTCVLSDVAVLTDYRLVCYQMLRCEQATDWRVTRCCGVNRLQTCVLSDVAE